MNKASPSVGRIAAMVIFALSCFGLLLFLWLAFGGAVPLEPKGYRIQASFPEAATLAKEADVRISGVPVGKVKDIRPDPGHSRSLVTLELDPKYAPLPSDAKAILRQKTLLGETYVELTPGTRRATPIPENGRLAAANVSPTVELDEILRTFRPATRRAFQDWMQSQAVAIRGHGLDLNNALGNLGPFAEDTARIVDVLNRQQGAVKRLVSNTGVVFGALSSRDGQLRSLIESANRVFATTARRDRELQQTFVALPAFERESRATLDRLTRFARNTNPLVTQLRPAARELSPTLQDLRGLSPDLVHLFRSLPALIAASREGFPAAERTLEDARPLIAQLDPFGRQLTPMLDFLGMYKRELTAFFANVVASTQAKDPGTTLHYLRTVNPLNLENLAVYPRRLGTNRTNAYAKPSNFDHYRDGLLSYETRHCGRSMPITITNRPPTGTVSDTVGRLQFVIPQSLVANLNTLLGRQLNGGAAPRCRYQGPYAVQGEVSQYPHVVKARGR